MKIRSLHGPWPFALVGALLILSSTFILGVMTFKEEQALLKVQKDMEAIESKREEAQRSGQVAKIGFDMASLQRSVVKFSVFQDMNLQKDWEAAYAAQLYSVVLEAYKAAGRDFIEQIENLEALRSKAIKGDNDALQKLSGLIVELIKASGEYKGNLGIEKAKLEINADKIKQSIISQRKWALFFQIIGLLVLLTKEFPDYIWGTKKQKD